MTFFQAIAIAVLQGVTELFPGSSLGHTVALPTLPGWGEIQSEPEFLPLIVIMQLGTAVALLIYFRAATGLISPARSLGAIRSARPPTAACS
jgi:undecaprenyl-diphosphatase